MTVLKKGDYITDIYGNKGKIASIYYDYVRLDTGKHVYKTAIERIISVV